MNIILPSQYLRETPGEWTYLPTFRRRLEFSWWKLLQIWIFLYYKSKARGDTQEKKHRRGNFVKIKNPTIIEYN